MLRYDHAERVTPKDAMEHSYFKPVKEYHSKNNGKWPIRRLYSVSIAASK